jgi:hypothetical protein
MANEKVYVEVDSIQSHIKSAVRDVVNDAEQAKFVIASVEDEVAQMFADCSIDELRRIAAVLRNHTVGMILSAVRMSGRADRLEAIADLRSLLQKDAEAPG